MIYLPKFRETVTKLHYLSAELNIRITKTLTKIIKKKIRSNDFRKIIDLYKIRTILKMSELFFNG